MEKGHSKRRGSTNDSDNTPPRLVTPPPYPQTTLRIEDIGAPHANYDGDDDITMRDEKGNRRENELTIPDATTPSAEGSIAPDPAHPKVMTSPPGLVFSKLVLSKKPRS